MARITVYTDGGCEPNPGRGGWGALIEYDGKLPKEIYGGLPETTNNQMEMTAVIEALLATEGPIMIHTDSKYVKNGITTWIKNWKRNGWKTRNKTPVKNKELWILLDSLVKGRKVSFRWVKGHAGNPGNERADELATIGMNNPEGKTER